MCEVFPSKPTHLFDSVFLKQVAHQVSQFAMCRTSFDAVPGCLVVSICQSFNLPTFLVFSTLAGQSKRPLLTQLSTFRGSSDRMSKLVLVGIFPGRSKRCGYLGRWWRCRWRVWFESRISVRATVDQTQLLIADRSTSTMRGNFGPSGNFGPCSAKPLNHQHLHSEVVLPFPRPVTVLGPPSSVHQSPSVLDHIDEFLSPMWGIIFWFVEVAIEHFFVGCGISDCILHRYRTLRCHLCGPVNRSSICKFVFMILLYKRVESRVGGLARGFVLITPPERSALPFCVGRIRLWTHLICCLHVSNHFVMVNLSSVKFWSLWSSPSMSWKSMAILSPRPSSRRLALIGSVTWLQSVKCQDVQTEAELQRHKDRNRIIKGEWYASVANGGRRFEKMASPIHPTTNK